VSAASPVAGLAVSPSQVAGGFTLIGLQELSHPPFPQPV